MGRNGRMRRRSGLLGWTALLVAASATTLAEGAAAQQPTTIEPATLEPWRLGPRLRISCRP